MSDKTEEKLNVSGRNLKVKDKKINLNTTNPVKGLHVTGVKKKAEKTEIHLYAAGLKEKLPHKTAYAATETESSRNSEINSHTKTADSRVNKEGCAECADDRIPELESMLKVSRNHNTQGDDAYNRNKNLPADVPAKNRAGKTVLNPVTDTVSKVSETIAGEDEENEPADIYLYYRQLSGTKKAETEDKKRNSIPSGTDEAEAQENMTEDDTIKDLEERLGAKRNKNKTRNTGEKENYLKITKAPGQHNNSREENYRFLKTTGRGKKKTGAEEEQLKAAEAGKTAGKKAGKMAGVKESMEKNKENAKNKMPAIMKIYTKVMVVSDALKDPDDGMIKFMFAIILKIIVSLLSKIMTFIISAIAMIMTLVISILGPVIVVVICLVTIFAFVFGKYFGDYWVDTSDEAYLSNYIVNEVHADFMAEAKEYIKAKDKYIILYPVVDNNGDIIAFGEKMDKETDAVEKAYLARIYAEDKKAADDLEELNKYMLIDTDEEKETIKEVHEKMFYIEETDMYIDSVNEEGENVKLQVIEIFGLKLSGYLGKYSSELSSREKEYLADFAKYE